MAVTNNPYNLAYLEQLYEEYLRSPDRVSPEWRRYFEQMAKSNGSAAHFQLGPSFNTRSVFHGGGEAPSGTTAKRPAAPSGGRGRLDPAVLQERVDQLVRNYRVRGHMLAAVDPLGQPRPEQPDLDAGLQGVSETDLDQRCSADSIGGPNVQTARQILERMRSTYCRSIGVQFMHIHDSSVRRWLQDRMESTENRTELSRAEQLRILQRLTDAVVFERFLQTKYIGAKTFSLEGGETLIPLLDLAIERAGEHGIREIVLGMAHRGRLNVLANIMGKSPQMILREFEDIDPELHFGGGDVKHHLGYSTDWTTSAGTDLHLSLCFNPSHLEFINPVALGRVRAKQDRRCEKERLRGMAMLIHGDAAIAGEGIVQESLSLSQLRGYTVGGTLHVVVNNQLGFTTPPQQYHSSTYCTDIAKMLQIPIFYVNGEDPEAVAQVVRLAMDFRREFRRDVIIDMYCYRRLGHNEGDEPSFTQPLLYETIEQRPSVRQAYLEHLLKLGGVSREEADQMEGRRKAHLEEALREAREAENGARPAAFGGVWSSYRGGLEEETPDVETGGVDRERLRSLLERLTEAPEGFQVHRKLRRGLQARREMAEEKRPLDWSAAEALAFASLATEGKRVRMSGQDTERGTFSQRHAVLHDTETDQTYVPLKNLTPDQAPVEIYNSPLSEAGVLGYEYGYSLDYPDGLVLWEAQFGDFVNAAQVIIDQFITSAEDKWRRLSGVVLLLPHGFQGQGPEHSSARLERFLMLAAEDNIQVVNATTPAQYFHLLRRQVLRPWRKPLVVMAPKSLLRHEGAVSSIDELTRGTFQRVIGDEEVSGGASVDRILLCTGKIYYELLEQRRKLERDDVAIVRVEQLYPFPHKELNEALAGYADETPVVWVQEEPHNMGAWPYMWSKFGHRLAARFPFSAVTRPESASPATGSHKAHKLEQERLIDRAFGDLEQEAATTKLAWQHGS